VNDLRSSARAVANWLESPPDGRVSDESPTRQLTGSERGRAFSYSTVMSYGRQHDAGRSAEAGA